MPEISAAIVVLVPLVLLVWIALHLLHLGLTAKELTEAARQRTAGCGIMLLYVAIPACIAAFVAGLYWLGVVLKVIRP
jgi:hypothetical protein